MDYQLVFAQFQLVYLFTLYLIPDFYNALGAFITISISLSLLNGLTSTSTVVNATAIIGTLFASWSKPLSPDIHDAGNSTGILLCLVTLTTSFVLGTQKNKWILAVPLMLAWCMTTMLASKSFLIISFGLIVFVLAVSWILASLAGPWILASLAESNARSE